MRLCPLQSHSRKGRASTAVSHINIVKDFYRSANSVINFSFIPSPPISSSHVQLHVAFSECALVLIEQSFERFHVLSVPLVYYFVGQRRAFQLWKSDGRPHDRVHLGSAPGKQRHQVAAVKKHGGDFVLVELYPEVVQEGIERHVRVALSEGVYRVHPVAKSVESNAKTATTTKGTHSV